MGILNWFLKLYKEYNIQKDFNKEKTSNIDVNKHKEEINPEIRDELKVSFNDTEDIGVITHYNGHPFTGIGYRSFDDGSIKTEIEMVNGLKNGNGKHYYPNGKIKREEYYKNDIKEGYEKVWFDIPHNKQLKQEGNYKNGLGDGEFISYTKEGEKDNEVVLKQNKKDGLSIKYYPNGQINSETNYKNDIKEGLKKDYNYETGKCVLELTYKNGKIIKRNDIGYKYKNGPLPLTFDGELYKVGSKVNEKGNGFECYLDNEQSSIYDCIKGIEIFTKYSHLVKGLDNVVSDSDFDIQDFYVWFKKSDKEKFKLLFPDILIEDNDEVINLNEEIEELSYSDTKNYKHISTECEYGDIKFTDDIEDIMEIISSNKEYKFYFRFKEYFDKGCLVQLEQLEKSDKIISKWNEKYEWEYENDELEERGVGGNEDNFDNTNMFHEVSDVECITLYQVQSDSFRNLLINLINEHKPSYLQELIDQCVEGEKSNHDPGGYEEEFLCDSLGIDYDTILHQQYLTEVYRGFKVTWLRYVQGNYGGESFEFGYIEK